MQNKSKVALGGWVSLLASDMDFCRFFQATGSAASTHWICMTGQKLEFLLRDLITGAGLYTENTIWNVKAGAVGQEPCKFTQL